VTDPDTQRAGYLRTDFLERIAHELRGPAGVTLGALNEIERALGDQTEELQSLLRMARRGVRRILRTADRLDRTAQLGAADPRRGAMIDLQVLVGEVARDTVLLEARGGVHVEVAEGGVSCVIDADGPWVRAAVAELVANAIRFARAHVSVEARATDDEAHVVVCDDGPGFAGPAQARFEPPITGRGLGLSLPLVEDVARAYGGRVEFRDRSKDGSGSTGTCVCLALPLAVVTVRGR
jgi:signal transduction histidine kinase